MSCDHSLKNKVFIILEVVLCTCIYTAEQIFMLLCLQKTRTFILTGCRVYEDSFTEMKRWNAPEVTQSSSGDDVRVFMSSLRCHVRFCVC